MSGAPAVRRVAAIVVAFGLVAWCPRAEAASAVASLAPEIARGLGDVPPGAVVVAAPLASDKLAPKGDELAVRVASLIAGKLGGAAHAHGSSAPLSVARAVAGKGGALVYVQVEVAKGEFRATADLYPVMSNGWDRVRWPAPAPRAHAFASAPIDAEVRTFLPAVNLEQARVHKAKHDQGEVLAIACGDIDGDGGNDLLLVSRASVAWGHLFRKRFVAVHAAAWSAMATRTPAPMRDALATAVIASAPFGTGGSIFVGVTDRGGVAASRDLLGEAPLLGMPVATPRGVACVAANAAASAFESASIDCFAPEGRGAAPAQLEPPAPSYDAVASAEVILRDGSTRALDAAREPGGKLRLRFGEEALLVEGAGAQVAVGDLDQDGVPEVVTTADAGEDVITVSSWAGSELRPRVHFAAPAGVTALSICPPDARGVPALVVVVGGEVWVVE